MECVLCEVLFCNVCCVWVGLVWVCVWVGLISVWWSKVVAGKVFVRIPLVHLVWLAPALCLWCMVVGEVF